jgi:hypothetical protein
MYWEWMHVQMRAEDLLVPQKLTLFHIEESLTNNETTEANLEADNVDCPDEIRDASNADEDELWKELQNLSPICSPKCKWKPLHRIQQKIDDVLRFMMLQKG